MEKEPYLVSILVPIYGVEKYIERCAISLFEQTYSNIEYVFVDDCTKDKSIEILQTILEKYPNRNDQVRIIRHERNKGLAASRNTAVSNSNGEFIIHVDSDDWVDFSMVEKLVALQVETSADIVTADYYYVLEQGNKLFRDTDIEDPKTILEALLTGNKIGSRIWGRLIRNSLYKDNNILLREGANFAEDHTTLVKLLYFSHLYKHLPEPLYYYECSNSGSYTNSFSAKNSIQSLENNDDLSCFFMTNSPKYLGTIKFLELMKVSGHMILCSKNRANKEYYNNVLLKRLSSIDRKYRRQLPFNNRMAVWLHYFEIVRLYVKLGGFLKRITK